MSVRWGSRTLDYEFPGRRPAGQFVPALVGVVGSGNLEVLLEPAPTSTVVSRTNVGARLGGHLEAVLRDFSYSATRWPRGRSPFNDMGADAGGRQPAPGASRRGDRMTPHHAQPLNRA